MSLIFPFNVYAELFSSPITCGENSFTVGLNGTSSSVSSSELWDDGQVYAFDNLSETTDDTLGTKTFTISSGDETKISDAGMDFASGSEIRLLLSDGDEWILSCE